MGWRVLAVGDGIRDGISIGGQVAVRNGWSRQPQARPGNPRARTRSRTGRNSIFFTSRLAQRHMHAVHPEARTELPLRCLALPYLALRNEENKGGWAEQVLCQHAIPTSLLIYHLASLTLAAETSAGNRGVGRLIVKRRQPHSHGVP